MTDLGTLGGGYSSATGINDAGRVVGDFTTDKGFTHAFITGPNGVGMTDLGTFGIADPGHPYTFSAAYGINDAGQVVGQSYNEAKQDHAFITGPNGTGMTDLGTLGGDNFSSALGINDMGQVVGYSFTTSEGHSHAFITGPNGAGMTDLGSLVNLPANITSIYATAINNQGQMAAVGVVPEPETYAMLLSGLGLIGFLARRRAAA
jgi:probable HAF family extracellular repeat protein